jgi:ribose-phosphate pyrophosphokinase
MMDGPMLFALNASHGFGLDVARALGIPLAEHEERQFEDGEHKSRPLENVRGRDVYVIQSLHGQGEQTVDQKLVRLLFFIGALKESAAERVTALVPYLCYSRKDRRTKPNDPVTTRYVATLLESVGTDRVLTMDVHNLAAYQNAFRCATEHLEVRHVFVKRVSAEVGEDKVTVLSPDAGGVKRAERFRELLQEQLGRAVGNGLMEKRRSSGKVSGQLLFGDVANHTVVIVDDLIAGGSTLVRAALACQKAGALRILAAAAHGLFVAGASDKLFEAPIERIFVADTVPPEKLDPELLQSKVEVIGVAPFLAEAIRRMHEGRSLVDMSEAYDF